MPLLTVAVMVLLAILMTASSSAAINVLPLRVDNPSPDGDGVVFIKLQADPADPAVGDLAKFQITSLNFLDGQVLKMWDATNNNCNGTALAVSDYVLTDGKVCFWSDKTQFAEFENSFTYAAVDAASVVGDAQTVTVVNYDVQACPGIPDLGASGFSTVPSSPEVLITLDNLQIKFEVTTAYVRNHTAWFIDFFDFNSAAGGDSASGLGRTCSNHASATFSGMDFSQWWHSQPRATFNSSVQETIEDALANVAFPMYDPALTTWTLESVGCDKVKYTAVIPTASLISNVGATNCNKDGLGLPAATASGLNYTANLFVVALRPKDLTNATAGYYKATYTYPFSFRLQQTVTDISTTSPGFNFQVAVDNLQVRQGQGLTLQLETVISAPSASSPNLLEAGFALPGYPNKLTHESASKLPVLTRGEDNGHCGTGSTLPCAISWSVTINELSLAEAGSMAAYNQQYIGEYSFTWQTVDGDVLAAKLIIDAVAANSTDLGELDVDSDIHFFRSRSDMQATSSSGLAVPTFSSGEQIWVRHSFLVDAADVAAYRFSLQRAWVCWSPVADFTPTVNPGTGCSQDVPGVMEAALGHRFLLYNISVGGIADTPASGPTQKSRIWGWSLVAPTASDWADQETVHNGFGINALPLASVVTGEEDHRFFFHLVSEVSQAPQAKRLSASAGKVKESIVAKKRSSSTGNGSAMSSFTVISESAGAASALSMPLFHFF